MLKKLKATSLNENSNKKSYGPTFYRTFLSAIDSIYYLGRRAILAFAGISVGCAAVTALINIGSMAQQEAVNVFKGMGSDIIIANLQPSPGKKPAGLLPHDFDENIFKVSLPDIQVAAGIIIYSLDVRHSGNTVSSLIVGANSGLSDIMKFSISNGRFLSRMDAKGTYAVIGSNVAFKNRSGNKSLKLGDHLTIGNYVYEIVGILQPHGENPLFPFNPDDAVFLPIDGMKRLIPLPMLSAVMIKYHGDVSAQSAAKKIIKYLKSLKNELNVNIQIPQNIIDGMTQQSRLFSWLLIFISSIAMISGGIGIMNVMLMTISERKKEIGIRLAIGGRPKDITTQFLIEAILLSVVGAFIGCIIGVMGTAIFYWFSSWSEFIITMTSILLGAGSSIGTGIFFGIYPAVSAARTEPVRALNDV